MAPGGCHLTAASYLKPELIAPTNADWPLILYIDANKRLQVGTWVTTNTGQVTSNNILFTKGGGVVAFTKINDSDGWGSGDIKFNPTSFLSSSFEKTATAWAGYTAIPYWGVWPGTKPSSGYGVTAFLKYISEAPYHTLQNVKSGFGDVCQLVGYTQEAVAEMTELPPPTYRLPTNAENNAFMGYPGVAPEIGYTSDIGSGYGSWVSGSPGYVTLLKSTPANLILPAVGDRHDDGSPTDWGSGIYWWSSTPGNAANVYTLQLSNRYVQPSRNYDTSLAFTVRCVPY